MELRGLLGNIEWGGEREGSGLIRTFMAIIDVPVFVVSAGVSLSFSVSVSVSVLGSLDVLGRRRNGDGAI